MKNSEIPSDESVRNKKSAALTRNRKTCGIFSFSFAIIGIICLIGSVVCIVLTEVGERSETTKNLLYILSGSLLGGTLIIESVAVLFSRLMQSAHKKELDYRERCDSENSFFVGKGTLATFGADSVTVHAEQGGEKQIVIPYSEMRFFSVCTRRRPREKGEWSVVMEIPVKYLSKEEAPQGKFAYVQTDAKERLYRCLEERGLPLLGEERQTDAKKKFRKIQKFPFRNATAKKRFLIQLAVGIALAGAGTGVAFWQVTFGAILVVFGAFVIGRAVNGYLGKKCELSFYDEGIFWKDENPADNVFLKWEEIQSVSPEEQKGVSLIKVNCAYGSFFFLNREGILEYIKENHSEKCAENNL